MEIVSKYTIEDVNEIFAAMDQIGKYFGIRVEAVGPDFGTVVMPLGDRHLNCMHTAHGAVIFALADLAFGTAAAGRGLCCVNAQTSLNIVNPGLAGPMRATARIVKPGRRLMVYDITITDGNDAIVAKGTVTGYVKGDLGAMMAEYERVEKERRLRDAAGKPAC